MSCRRGSGDQMPSPQRQLWVRNTKTIRSPGGAKGMDVNHQSLPRPRSFAATAASETSNVFTHSCAVGLASDAATAAKARLILSIVGALPKIKRTVTGGRGFTMKHNTAPVIAAILLLLLPVLYVGSYCALVTPTFSCLGYQYRCGYTARIEYWLTKMYWPLEHIDRKLRPAAWGIMPRLIIVEEDEERLGFDFEDASSLPTIP